MNFLELNQLLSALSTAVEVRDLYTSKHQSSVSNLSRFIAQEMDLDKIQVESIRLAATLHDIGKLGVPTSILSKAGKLRQEEFELIKLHSVIGEDILKVVDFSTPVPVIVRQHHERMDGSGYPDGLVGNQILLEARIIAVADVLDSMSSSRAYRRALGLPVAIDELNRNKGVLYDIDVVDACLNIYKKYKKDMFNSENIWGVSRSN